MARKNVENTDILETGRTKWNDNDTELYASVQPASPTNRGTTKLSTAPIDGTNPIAVSDNDPRNTNSRPPTAHASAHAPGGPDALAVDAAANTGSLRTLGTGASQAAAGNDPRFGGAPGNHADTHEPGGADAMDVDAPAGTGSLRTLGTGAQQAAPGNDTRLSDARTPTSHASSHQPGGSDAMTVDAPAATGSLRTLGTGSQQAAAGNDARLSNARTPVIHASSHQPGGSDAMAVDAAANTGSLRTLGIGAQQAAAGDDSRFLPIATQAEVNTGTNDAKAITPLKLASRSSSYVFATSSATQTFTANADVKVTYGSEINDTLNEYSSSRFTASRAGRFRFEAGIVYNFPSSGRRLGLHLFKNGTVILKIAEARVDIQDHLWIGGSATLLLATNDYIEVYTHVGSSNLDTIHSTHENYFIVSQVF